MSYSRCLRGLVCVGAVALLAGCVAPKAPFDYTAFREHMPRSILVLPPLNESTEVMATYSCLSFVTEPLAEMGYYVYPVALIDAMMKENGQPTSGEMHQVPPAKLHEIIGADAVLYMTVEDYGTKFHGTSSVTRVRLRGKLVDSQTGRVLWTGLGEEIEDSSEESESDDSQERGSIGEQVVGAIISQIFSSATEDSHSMAGRVVRKMFESPTEGLLYGPRHPLIGSQAQLIPLSTSSYKSSPGAPNPLPAK